MYEIQPPIIAVEGGQITPLEAEGREIYFSR
jgi:hypothetical protein